MLSATSLGAEYQLNTTVANDQRTVAIGSNPSSTQIVMVWVSVSQDGSGEGVYAQRYDLNGAAVGAAFRVNATTSGNQGAPAVAMDALGEFVVAWQNNATGSAGDGSGYGIYARRFGYDGTPMTTSDFRVNTTTSGDQLAPAVAMDDVGNFAIAFQSATSGDGSGATVFARFYDATGAAKTTSNFQVNQATSGNQQAPSIAMGAAGAVIAWQSAGQDTNGDAVVARMYSTTGTALANEFVVNQTIAGNQNTPSVASNADGSFVVAWQSAGQDGSGNTIVARRYDNTGAASDNEFVVNQFTTGDQAAPSVTSAGASGFVIAWQSALQDGNSDAVVARQYTAVGAPAGNEFIANTFVTGAQNNPSVAMENDGDFLVAWQSPGQETGGGSTLGVFARRYSAANDAPVMKQIQNQIADVGGTISFTAKATDEDLAIDAIQYSLGAGAPAGASINPTTGAFSWNTTDVTPGRYFVPIVATDLAGATDQTQVATTVFAPGTRTALDDYVNAIDPAYSWTIRDRVVGDGFSRYDVLLVSGNWRTTADVDKPLWQHWMYVYVPNVVTADKAVLFIDGGSFTSTPSVNPDIDGYAGPLAASTGTVFIDLMAVPSEPLKFTDETSSRTEDQIIAYSWAKYLQTNDPTWIVNLPMTRSAVRAMDAALAMLQSPVGGNLNVGSFLVSGGSKRGWTTWLASAVDPRVAAEAPIVADLLNTEASFVHHYAYYNGTFAPAVQDYVNAGVLNVNNFGTESMNSLLHIVDPFSYVDRLTLPKYILNASGDEFFVPDSWKYYYDQLQGPKAIRYFPNSGHGTQSVDQVVESLVAMVTMVNDVPLPQYDFHQLADGTIEVTTSETVTSATLWQATNPNARDFRNAYVGSIYTSSPLTDQGGGVYRANVPVPTKGYTAYYIELAISTPFGDIKVSTGIYLKGNPPTNNPPVLQPISNLTVNEGSPVSIQALATDPDVGQTLKYYLDTAPAQLSINQNTGLITGVWNDQVAGLLPVTVSAWDNGTPLLPDRNTFRITVVNVAPTAMLNGSTSGQLNQPLSFTLLASDPSTVDQAAGFTFKIDWNGDGSDVETVQGASGLVVQHTFTTPGARTIALTATDKDGGLSQASTLGVNVNRPPVDPQNQIPLSITEGDSLLLQATGWTDPDGDSLSYAWDVDGDGQYDDATGASATLTWSNLVAIGVADNGAYTVRLRVDDGHGGVTISAPISLSIANAPPTAIAGGPYTITEGGSLTLAGFGVDPAGAADPLSYSWDVNGDGNFSDAVGANPTLTWSQLVALNIYDGPASYNVQVRVNDGDGGVTDSAPVSLTLNNASPALTFSGPTASLRGTTATYTMSVTDPSPSDAIATFTFTVDWGDGTPLAVFTGGNGLQLSHAFNSAGPFVVSITATDVNGGVSLPATRGVQVDAVRLQPNADNASLTDLVWSGSNLADNVTFEQISATTIRVHEQLLAGVAVNNQQDYTVTGRVIAYGNAGDDTLRATGLSTKVTLDGGANNNTIYGSNGGDVLIGGSNGGEGKQGNNVIIAGNGANTIYGNDVWARKSASGGNNLIVGGSGADVIYGNFGPNLVTPNNPAGNGGEGGQNLIVAGGGADTIYASQIVDGVEGGHGSVLIGGSTNLAPAALLSVLSEWTSAHTYEQKVANISGVGTADRLNGDNFLKPGQTVANDAAIDDIFSDTNGKANWLLYTFSQDAPHRVKAGDSQSDTP